MPRGLPSSYIKKAKRELGKGASWSRVFKRAWELYKGSKVYEAVKGNPGKKSSRKKKKGGSRLAKKKSRRRRSFSIPLAPIGGFLASPGIQRSIKGVMAGNWDEAMAGLQNLVGWLPSKNQWNFNTFIQNITPILAGLLVHKFVGGKPLNLNRTLARAGVPLIRI